MGLTSLDNTPRPVPLPDAHEEGGGSLHAMMLDMKRTFDEIVEAHSDPDRAAQILANPFYQSLSSSFAGTQEYMAMEKLGQLRRADEWDLIVVDTPPSRSALDFLDAPQRLSRFLDGRLIRLLTAPTRVSSRAYLKVVNAGFGMFTGVVAKVLVHSGMRRKGFGRALMSALEDVARRQGRTLLVLDTISGSDAAVMYQRLGWTRAGEIPRYAAMPDGALAPTTYYCKDIR